MRNTLVQTLPPRASMTIEVSPPIAPNERTFFMSTAGVGTVDVVEDDPSHVTFRSLVDQPAPFVFSVGPRVLLPPVVTKWMRLLGGL